MDKHHSKTTFIAAALAAFIPLQVLAQDGGEYVIGGEPEWGKGFGAYASVKFGGLGGGLDVKHSAEDYDYEAQAAVAVALGMRATEHLRVEFEFMATGGDVSDYDDISARTLGVGLQAFLTVPLADSLWLYAGGGGGFLNCELEAGTGEYYAQETYHSGWWFDQDYYSIDYREHKQREDANYFYWTAAAGVEYFFTSNLSIDLSGRYIGTARADFGAAESVSLEMFGAFVGMTLSF